MIDFTPATQSMSQLLQGVRDEQLGDPTPCPAYTVADLVDHIAGLTVAFTDAARKTPGSGQPSGDVDTDLKVLAEAWRDPEAWTGMTAAGGVDLPGDVAGRVALNELAVHGWDLARATGQEYDVDETTLRAAKEFMDEWPAEDRGDAFGPVVVVPEQPSLLDHVVGLSGRDPGWAVLPGATQAP